MRIGVVEFWEFISLSGHTTLQFRVYHGVNRASLNLVLMIFYEELIQNKNVFSFITKNLASETIFFLLKKLVKVKGDVRCLAGN